MIKYNNSNIYDWFFSTDNIIKVYRNNAICYYKVTPSGGTPQFDVCYAVVDNIQSYSATEFTDVYDTSTEKWYKLNNLGEYEEYGVYGSGRNITYYEGKLTIDGDYEYIYSGSSWVSVGEVSGSTATLPNVAFSVNYNAKNYDANTKTLAKTSGQLADTDAVVILGTPTVNDGYLGITTSCRVDISGYQTYVNRDNSHPNLTIISKQRTDGNKCHMFANRDSSYNWMYRCYSNKLTLHGSSEQGNIAVTTQPVIESVRVDSNRLATYNNYTDNTSSTYSSFNYGATNSGSLHLFWGGYGSEYFSGDFYWVYMSQNTLTDDQVQQVIAYNEGGGGQPIYPLYYDEKQDPLNNLSFSSMTEAVNYAYNNCVYDGMRATIAGDRYYFDSEDENGWVANPSRLPNGYTELEYIENSTSTQNYQRTNMLSLAFADSVTNDASAYTYSIVMELTAFTKQYENCFGYGYVELQRYNNQRAIVRAFGREENVTAFNPLTNKFKFKIWKGENDTYPTYYLENLTQGTSPITGYVTSNRAQMTNNYNKVGLFHFANESDTGAYTPKGRIYEVTVEDRNGNLVCNGVPCKRDSDGKLGFYNLARNEFEYDESGVLSLTGGPEV